MILSALIKGKGKSKNTQVATATSAIFATQPLESTATVARIATLAIASTADTKNTEARFSILNNKSEMVQTSLVLDKTINPHAKFDDDRRHCAQCKNLTSSGLCSAAMRGELLTSRNYHPMDHIPRRCEGYVPRHYDPDQRTGQERWPRLTQRKTNKLIEKN